MKIKISKNYGWMKSMYEYDSRRFRQGECFTIMSNYSPEWEIIEVTDDELFEYIKKGYAIKINMD